VRWPRLILAAYCLLAPACLKVPGPDPTAPEPATEAAPPAVLWPGSDPGSLYEVGEVRGFRIEQGTQLIAKSWGRYVGLDAAGLHVFETRIELHAPGVEPVRSVGRLRLDERGALVDGFERSRVVELNFKREGDVLTISDGTRSDEIAFDDDTAYIARGAVLHTELMYGLRRLVEGALDWRVVSLSGGPPFAWSAEVVRFPAQPGGSATVHTNLGERVTLERGRLMELKTDEAAQLVVPMREAVWPEWTIASPQRLVYTPPPGAKFDIKPLEIDGGRDEPTLAAELLVPHGRATPRPAVLFLSRMAGEDRHGIVGPPSTDMGTHEIHDALAEAGFVVLRFDERGVGGSEEGAASYAGQLQDARRAYATLLLQESVDPDRVIVVGHGEGALRALALGAQEGERLAGLALLASPGRRYQQLLRFQAEGRLADAPPKLREGALKEQEEMVAAMLAGSPPPELAAHAQWLTEIFAVNPPKLLSQVRARLLLVQGGKDFEVDPTVDLDLLIKAASKHSVTHKVARYPMLDHLMKVEPGESRAERYRVKRNVDPTFLADLVRWAKAVTPS